MSEQTTSDERCVRCGYLIGPAQTRSWWDGIGPYHSQCTPLVDNQYQVLVAENAELKRLYNELIMEVVNKIEGETRHETALRCIREHERRDSGPAQSV